MAEVTMEMIKTLRERSGAGIMDCKAALAQTDGDMDKAMDILRKKRADIADKKAGRAAKNGLIHSYMHVRDLGGVPTVGVLVEVNCETDFAAKTPVIKKFANDVCLHIAMANPRWMSPSEVPADVIEKEKTIYREQLKESGKPDNIIEKILEGRIKKFCEENCLMDQVYALAADKSEQKTIQAMLKETSGQLGENMAIRRFVRFDVKGE
jgi:elongation factor Ts